jgi:hypothetical protein
VAGCKGGADSGCQQASGNDRAEFWFHEKTPEGRRKISPLSYHATIQRLDSKAQSILGNRLQTPKGHAHKDSSGSLTQLDVLCSSAAPGSCCLGHMLPYMAFQKM